MRTDGVASLKAALRERVRSSRPLVRVRLPLSDGAGLAALYRMGEVVERTEVDGYHEVTLRVESWQAEQLAERGSLSP